MIEVKEKINRLKGESIISLPKDYTVIDIETTGLDYNLDEIIELSALKVRNEKIIDKFSTLVKPSYMIGGFITSLTGITNEMVNNAPLINDIIEAYINFIGDDIVIGHNVNFDVNFIYDSYKKCTNKDFSNKFVDTLRLSRRILPQLKHHRLFDLLNYYKIDVETMHRGCEDCISTNNIYLCLKQDILEKYTTENEFLKEINKQKYYSLNANDIKTDNIDFDITHPLYDKKCVFTGALEKMKRKDAMQKVVDVGGFVQNAISKETNFLIVGSLDYIANLKGEKSSKLKKAENMKLKGLDIEIISENVFYDLLDLN